MADLIDGQYCFYVDETMFVEGKGFRPSIIVKGQQGHFPNVGAGVKPWYWGEDIKTARAITAGRNKRLGLSQADVNKLVAESMRT
ncbi:hypothetical protein LCGC14_0236000 [marine sediment metagenome]|uniref:Uncharacterized protein n=1 Tax=marine sediment metagenome TaxID=412755 RepID=A0A0F9UDK3_9ZZZZ